MSLANINIFISNLLARMKETIRGMGNIKMDLRERGWGGMDWIDLAKDRNQWSALVNTVMKI
jgi:hypothetical protein